MLDRLGSLYMAGFNGSIEFRNRRPKSAGPTYPFWRTDPKRRSQQEKAETMSSASGATSISEPGLLFVTKNAIEN
jgi:hypothetical protein